MSVPFTKLFSSITTSTIWREDDKTRIIWITMLAMSNKHGEVIASIPGLADLARVPLEETVKALEKLSSPDKWSSSQEYEGRRIEKIDRGWRLLNHAKFRDLVEVEERREYMRHYMRDYRKPSVNNVSKRKQSLADLTHTDTDTDAEAGKSKAYAHPKSKLPSLGEVQAYCAERGNLVNPEQWFNYYTSNGWRVGRNPMKDWRAAVRTWEKNGIQGVSNGRLQQPDKRQQREQQVARNQESILAGLGIGHKPQQSGDPVQVRVTARGSKNLAGLLPVGEPRDGR